MFQPFPLLLSGRTSCWYPHYNDVQDDHRRQGLALLKAMDDAVGGLVAKLRELNLEEKTLILFAGDNGAPGRFDTGAIGSWNGSNNVPMRGPKGTLHEGGIRVPMFAYWKGRISPGQVIEEMVTTLDFTATSLAVVGGRIPPEFDGVNLMPRLTGDVPQIQREQPMYWDFYSGQAIRMGDWKLWRNADTTVLFIQLRAIFRIVAWCFMPRSRNMRYLAFVHWQYFRAFSTNS